MMAVTRRFKSKKKDGKWIDTLLIFIFGLMMTGALIGSIFEKYGEYTYGAMVVTALIWSTVEIMTPRARSWADALIRFIPAFIVGSIIGGILTYFTQFGYYVIQPALSGNLIGIFALAMMTFVSLIIIWTAVWAHNLTMVRMR